MDSTKHLSIERQIESNSGEMNERMLNIDPRSLNLLRENLNPSENILNIVKSVLLSLNVSDSEVNSWENCKKYSSMYSENSLFSRMRNAQETAERPRNLREIEELLARVHIEDLQNENIGIMALYLWARKNYICYSQ